MTNQDGTKESRKVTADEARELLAEQERSGLSIAAFARDRGVAPWTLYNARNSVRAKKRPATGRAFAEVLVADQVDSTKADGNEPIQLALPSGLILRVSRHFDEVSLRRLLGVLASC